MTFRVLPISSCEVHPRGLMKFVDDTICFGAGVYPLLVGVAGSGRASGCALALREALLQFGALLAAPP